jgi:hypothetical protein
MFPFCPNATPLASRGTVPKAIANKVFMYLPSEMAIPADLFGE